MTEDQQPVWVNSGLPTATGVYIRQLANHRDCGWFAYFDGEQFYNSSTNNPDDAICMGNDKVLPSYQDQKYLTSAWWDYQGLMAKPKVKDEAAFGLWVQGLTDGAIKIEVNRIDWSVDAAIMETDEPGITAMAERNKPAPEPEKIVVGGLTIDMADLVEFLKTKQPKPEPNTTPRGILSVWNESADHRLGMWRTME